MESRICLGFVLALAACGLASAGDFADVSVKAGVADAGLGKGVAMADVNNDGFTDIYVSNKGGANRLYLNKGDGAFRDFTAQAGPGVDHPGFTMGSVFGDYDNDGCVDLYLATGGQYEIEPNRLFKGKCDGTFTEVTEKAGVGLRAFTYGASFVDYDNDGWLDIYCANYGVGAKNVLYRNNGDGTFRDVTDAAGVGDPSWSWMGVWADVNGDNWPDLYVVNGRYPAGEPNRLYLNNRNGTFSEAAKKAGVDDPNWGLGAAFGDIDNDGDLDLFVSNYVGPNGLYLNDGKGKFVNVADRQPVLKCETVRTKGTAFGDIDNDGDLDLYVVNWGAPNKLFLNKQNDGNWLKVKLTGTVSNRSAFGSKVKIFDPKTGKLLAMREIRSATGFCAQEPNVAHFGLKAWRTYDVAVTFPSGIEVRRGGVKPGRPLEIVEPKAKGSR